MSGDPQGTSMAERAHLTASSLAVSLAASSLSELPNLTKLWYNNRHFGHPRKAAARTSPTLVPTRWLAIRDNGFSLPWQSPTHGCRVSGHEISRCPTPARWPMAFMCLWFLADSGVECFGQLLQNETGGKDLRAQNP